jgi:ABC-type uncharacterized transport system auxiliary subunit
MKIKLFYAICFIALLFGCNEDDNSNEITEFLPEVTTEQTTNITSNSAKIIGIIPNNGNNPITQKGICWSTTSVNPDLKDSKTEHGSGNGQFESTLESLQSGTIYYARAYATNEVGTSYGKTVLFETHTSLVTITTTEATNVEFNTASVGATLSVSNTEIIEKGICWSISSLNPDLSHDHTKEGASDADFESSLTELVSGTTYYARAYTTTENGVTYGNTVLFKTKLPLPEVSSIGVIETTENTALVNGKVEFPSNLLVTQRGFCWNTEENPTIDNNFTSDGTGSGEFNSTIENLSANTNYFARAYAINSEGVIAYGENITFKTKAIPPVLTTIAITVVEQTTAKSGGAITTDNNVEIIARGVCWSVTSNPTINDNTTSNGTGSDAFESEITNLLPNTTYFVRAYATNSEGTTAYGNEEKFTTLPASITYPESTFNGKNILDLNFTELKTTERYSFSASLPKNTNLRIILTVEEERRNGELFWGWDISSIRNWYLGKFDSKNKTRTFEAISDNLKTDIDFSIGNDLKSLRIDYYENGDEFPTRSKILKVVD